MLSYATVARLHGRGVLRAPFFFMMIVSVLSVEPAMAQCVEGGAPTGESCLTTSTTYQGCCDGTSTVRWCEGGKVCSKDCSTSVMNTCCQYSANPGCCDQAVMEHVCYVLGAVKCCTQSWSPSCVAIAMLEANLQCPPGFPTSCASQNDTCGWNSGNQVYKCGTSHIGDPSGVFPLKCSTCAPTCAGKACGDDGCGGQCGTCPPNYTCNAVGECLPLGACVPACSGKACGNDGCGGTCGTCPANYTCNAIGECLPLGACVPSCSGKACGTDGCGSSCGTCPAPLSCTAVGTCGPAACAPSCAGKVCGDDGCGGSCGSCTGGLVCASGACATSCTPACDGQECGDDGCGGLCGSCDLGATCDEGICVTSICIPVCDGRTCGDDGCSGVCGYCEKDATCTTSGECVPGSQLPITTCPPGEEATWDGCIAIEKADRGTAAGCQASPSAPAPWALLGLLLLALRGRRSGRSVVGSSAQ